jgi:hypothetical protein
MTSRLSIERKSGQSWKILPRALEIQSGNHLALTRLLSKTNCAAFAALALSAKPIAADSNHRHMAE